PEFARDRPQRHACRHCTEQSKGSLRSSGDWQRYGDEGRGVERDPRLRCSCGKPQRPAARRTGCRSTLNAGVQLRRGAWKDGFGMSAVLVVKRVEQIAGGVLFALI